MFYSINCSFKKIKIYKNGCKSSTFRLSGIVGMALGTTKIGLMISFISSAVFQLGGIPVLLAMRTHPQHGGDGSFGLGRWPGGKLRKKKKNEHLKNFLTAIFLTCYGRDLVVSHSQGSSGPYHCCEAIWSAKRNFVHLRWSQDPRGLWKAGGSDGNLENSNLNKNITVDTQNLKNWFWTPQLRKCGLEFSEWSQTHISGRISE